MVSIVRRHPWAVLTILLAGIFALHAADLARPFFADDYLFLEQVRGRSLFAALAGPDPLGNFLRPVGRPLYFWVLGALGGGGREPWVYRLANLGLFLAATLLLFRIVRRLLGARAGVVAAILFGLHYAADVPLLWISGSQDLLATACALLCLELALAGRRLASALAFALALLSKESVALAPFVAVALLWAEGGSLRAALRRSLGTWIVAGAWAALWWASRASRPSGPSEFVPGAWAIPAALVHLAQVAGGLEFRGAAPGRPWPASLAALALALGAALLAWLGADAQGGAPRWPARPAAVRRTLVAAALWAVAGALPVVVVVPLWSAYFYLFAVGGAAMFVAAACTRAPRPVTAGIVALCVLLSANARSLDAFDVRRDAWTWHSHVNRHYVERSMDTITRYLVQLRRAYPVLPARSTVFFANVPVSLGWQTGDGPLVRWAYRDSSLRSYFLGEFTGARAHRGPVFFFAADGDSLVDHTRDPMMLPSFAYSMLLEDHLAEACEALDLALGDRSADPGLRYWRAWARYATGDTSGAAGDLRALGIAPVFSAAIEASAGSRVAVADTAERLRQLQAALAQAGWTPGVHARLAALDLRLAEREQPGTIEALAYRSLRPRDPDAWRTWASAQIAQGQYDGALRSLERYFELAPDHGRHDAEAQEAERGLKRLVYGAVTGGLRRP